MSARRRRVRIGTALAALVSIAGCGERNHDAAARSAQAGGESAETMRLEPESAEAQPAEATPPAPEPPGAQPADTEQRTQAPLAMPGPCVAVPTETFDILVTRSGGPNDDRRFRYSFATRRAHDFDRDGTPDALVPVPRAHSPEHGCPTDVAWDLYVTRGGCGHLVGRIHGDVVETPQATVTHGLLEIHTAVDVTTPRDPRQHVRYAFDGTAYREVSRRRDRARCEVHPADCQEPTHTRCELRGHSSIPSVVDGDEVTRLLNEAAAEAQASCAPTGAPTERCEVRPTFAADGSVAQLTVQHCPRRRACVRPIFERIRITPFTGDPPLQWITFQIPAP